MTMDPHWKCVTSGCPDRVPVPGTHAPVCYTCGLGMSAIYPDEIAEFQPVQIDEFKLKIAEIMMVPSAVVFGVDT